MSVPHPTPIFRIMHIDNLVTCLRRGALHAPNQTPKDGLPYRGIHDVDIQKQRHVTRIPCGPGGVIHDYVPFYFGYLSPMLLRLKTGRVTGYNEGQNPIIYLVSRAQDVAARGSEFVFSDGQGNAFNTRWYSALEDLEKVDWTMVYERYWKADYESDPDRQRRKQAEFLVYRQVEWTLIHEIGVVSPAMQASVEAILGRCDRIVRRPVQVTPEWYY